MGLGREGNIIVNETVSKPKNTKIWTDPNESPPAEDGFYMVIIFDVSSHSIYSTISFYSNNEWEIEENNKKCDAWNSDYIFVKSYISIPTIAFGEEKL